MKPCDREYREINRWIPCFNGFTEFTSSLPKLYWNVKSQEQRLLAICESLHKLICYCDYLGEKANIDHAAIVALQELFEKFMESGFDDYYAEQVEKWIDTHLQEIYGYTVGQIFFSVDDSGYLIAHVPVGWEQITFSTPLDYSDQSTYGRLCLSYEFDNTIIGG